MEAAAVWGLLPTPGAGGALAALAARANLGFERDLHRIRQLLHARQQTGAALIAESQLLGGVAAGLEGLEGLQGTRWVACGQWRWAGGGGAVQGGGWRDAGQRGIIGDGPRVCQALGPVMMAAKPLTSLAAFRRPAAPRARAAACIALQLRK